MTSDLARTQWEPMHTRARDAMRSTAEHTSVLARTLLHGYCNNSMGIVILVTVHFRMHDLAIKGQLLTTHVCHRKPTTRLIRESESPSPGFAPRRPESLRQAVLYDMIINNNKKKNKNNNITIIITVITLS